MLYSENGDVYFSLLVLIILVISYGYMYIYYLVEEKEIKKFFLLYNSYLAIVAYFYLESNWKIIFSLTFILILFIVLKISKIRKKIIYFILILGEPFFFFGLEKIILKFEIFRNLSIKIISYYFGLLNLINIF